MISISVIITIAVLLVLALAAPLCSPFFRKARQSEGSSDSQETMPSVTILVVEHDSSYHLEKTLPELLTQNYNGKYQVVVVIDQNDSESEDICKRMRNEHPHMYYTMLPVSSRYISRKKLGITIGMRAAKHEWVLLTDVHSMPTSEDWLTAMASHATPDVSLVMGTSLYDDEAGAYYRFDQLRSMQYHMKAAQNGQAYITNMPAIMIRKEDFFNKRGFHGNLEFQRAEFEFLVNKFAEEGKTATAIEPEARMTQFAPTSDRWNMNSLFRLNASKQFERSTMFRLLYHLDLTMMHAVNIATIIIMAMGTIAISMPEAGNAMGISLNDGIVLASASAALWLISLIERYFIYKPVVEEYSSLSPQQAIMLEWTVSLRNIMLRISHFFSDKNDFITHRL